MDRHRQRRQPAPASLIGLRLMALFCWALTTGWALNGADRASAAQVLEVPVLAAIDANNRGVFQVMVMSWDQRSAPDPVEITWSNSRVKVTGTALGALGGALAYAVDQSRSLHPTGTISIYGVAYAPISSDGPSAGAVMTVGLLAVLRGDPMLRGVALTGTLQPDGQIGPVGAIPDKVRAAAREGYRTILIPQGQLGDPRWNLNGLAMELRLTIKEVATIPEAYALMTGRRP